MNKTKTVDAHGVVHLAHVEGQYLRLFCQPGIGRMNLYPKDDAATVTSCIPCLAAERQQMS